MYAAARSIHSQSLINPLCAWPDSYVAGIIFAVQGISQACKEYEIEAINREREKAAANGH